MPSRTSKERQMRVRLAQEAARILAETGSRDFYAAKRKAAEHLGATETRNMPRNTEIEEALMTYLRLFRSEQQPVELQRLRQVAYQAMTFFAEFNPRLVGSVLRGSADANSTVTLHLSANTPEDVDVFLMQHHIPYRSSEQRLRFGVEQYQNMPAYRFLAEETPLEVIVFPVDGPHHAPLSPVDGKPMQRAGLSTVAGLLNNGPVVAAGKQVNREEIRD
jgi:hypothetical protein